MPYTTEDEVYDRTGMSSANIVTLSGKDSDEVSTLITNLIADAQKKIRDDVGYPIVITEEKHLGDGNKNQFKLGPQDEDYATLGDYDPTDNLIKVYNAWFARQKKWRPWPEDCDTFSEYSDPEASGWGGSYTSLDEEETIQVAGTYGLKVVFPAGGGYIEYHTSHNLDKIIDTWNDFFAWLRISDKDVTITLRLYDKDGASEEEDITLRQDDVGQYVWTDIDSMTGSIDWNNTRLQYFRIYVSGACTLYVDNICFADEWAFTAAEGLFHVSVADNITSESPPSEGYPFYVTYGYDPFLASVPANIAEATEWLVGVKIIDYLRGIRYRQTSFQVYGETLELDQDSSREGLLGVRTYMMKNYWRCLKDWGGADYGVVM